MLKRFTHILLLALYLFSTTELQELAKLPVLFQHFFEHKSINNSITFINYLEHHYSDIKHNDNDEERDNQLPFKTHGFCASGIVSPALTPSFYVMLKKVYQIIPEQKIIINNEALIYSAYSGKIWQPPKSIIFS